MGFLEVVVITHEFKEKTMALLLKTETFLPWNNLLIQQTQQLSRGNLQIKGCTTITSNPT
jgi:hypothetical protein